MVSTHLLAILALGLGPVLARHACLVFRAAAVLRTRRAVLGCIAHRIPTQAGVLALTQGIARLARRTGTAIATVFVHAAVFFGLFAICLAVQAFTGIRKTDLARCAGAIRRATGTGFTLFALVIIAFRQFLALPVHATVTALARTVLGATQAGFVPGTGAVAATYRYALAIPVTIAGIRVCFRVFVIATHALGLRYVLARTPAHPFHALWGLGLALLVRAARANIRTRAVILGLGSTVAG